MRIHRPPQKSRPQTRRRYPRQSEERIAILRKAFIETMRDPEFAAELKKAKLDLNPLDGATLENNIKELLALDNALIPKLTEILK